MASAAYHSFRGLGPVSGTALMFNNVLGAGILVLPGLAARQIGAHSFWTWVIAALVVMPFLAVFTILGVRHHNAGGIIHVARESFGPLGGRLTFALMMSAAILGLPSIALTGGYYLQGAFAIPAWIGASLILLTATSANLLSAEGAKQVGTYSSLAVIIFLSILVLSGGWTLYHNHAPVTLPAPGLAALGPFALVFFAFTGWEFSLGMAEEFRAPGRNLPIAMAGSWLLASFFYGLCAFIITKNGPAYWNEHPFLNVMTRVIGRKDLAQIIVSIGSALLIWANLFTLIWSLSRMLCRTIPLQALSLKKRGIPVLSVIMTGSAITAIALFSTLFAIPLSALLSSAGMNLLLVYGIAAAALWRAPENKAQRLSALISILLSITLAVQEPAHLIYPTIIVLGTLGLSVFQKCREKY